jgi:hypothetical protein
MSHLLNDAFAPITSEIEFINVDVQTAVDAFLLWQKGIQAPRGVTLSVARLSGSLENRLRSLLPLTTVEARRFLFVPTKSDWTAFFQNAVTGNDPNAIAFLSGKLSCQAIRASSIDNSVRHRARGGRFGAVIFEVFSPHVNECHFLNTRRSVFAANDGGRWKFGAEGIPFQFENISAYESPRIRDRFTHRMLCDYLAEFGIQFEESAFFETTNDSFLISKCGPTAKHLVEMSLEEVRESF